MSQLAVIADDLTGATDTSACFAGAGLSVVVPLGSAAHPAADIVSLTTESRDLAASEAARLVGSALSVLCATPGQDAPRWIYKKIDSALRGHPREELLAAIEAAGAAGAIIAPALPAEERTTVGGRQHIGGVPLEANHFGGAGAESRLSYAFANDRGLPIELLDLETIRHGPPAIARRLDRAAASLVIADAETDDDLLALAQAAAVSTPRVLCGSAGFARQLARALPLIPAHPRPVSMRRDGRPVLVVAGSQHAATKQQLAALGDAGVPVVRLTQAAVDESGSSIDPTVEEVARHLARGSAAVLTTVGLAPSMSGERTVASRLAEVTAAPAISERLGGLVLTGGDVAAAVCGALGATAIWLGGEITAGQPWGMLAGGMLPGLPVATKAGSFGGDDALIACMGFLRQVKIET